MSMALVDYGKAQRVISRRDPVMAQLVRRHGPCKLSESRRGDEFESLVRSILSQQLSMKAASTIASRFEGLFGGRFPRSSEVAMLPDHRLRRAGLSGQKVGYVRDLCRRIEDASLNLSTLSDLPDEQVVETLLQVKGVGRWTAEMFLIFRLCRPDVLPVGDLGIVKAVQRAYRLPARPVPKRLVRIAEAWRPYRSVACWYLWASLDNLPAQD